MPNMDRALTIKLALGIFGVVVFPIGLYFSAQSYSFFFTLMIIAALVYIPLAVVVGQAPWHWITWVLIAFTFNVAAAFCLGVWLVFESARFILKNRGMVDQNRHLT